MRWLEELVAWVQALDTGILFLMVLPFVVGAAGLLQYWLESREPRPRGSDRRLAGARE